jgi:hypothetical protein
MTILLDYPLALPALAALPVLLAIYLLRNRFRPFYVSSLMLWDVQRRHTQGGLNLDRLQTPLLFILEFLILTLLALAAADPLLRSKSDLRRLVIVLDDSFSMLARAETDSRQTAIRELKRYLKSSEPFDAVFISAGIVPNVLAAEADTMAEAAAAIEQWQCRSPAADLDKALALAGEIADAKARILVVSDHLPEGFGPDSRYECWSFGRALANAGFLHAERTPGGERDRCMLTIGNFSEKTKPVTLTIASLDGGQTLYQKKIELLPSEPYQMIFEPPTGTDVTAFIDDDALEADNRVILLCPETKPVRTAVSLEAGRLADSVNRLLEAIGDVRPVTEAPDLLITDKPVDAGAEDLPWTLRIVSEPNASAFAGPFIIDRNHPVTEGLDLQGVIWSASALPVGSSAPVISAGNTSLLEDEQDNHGAHHLRLNFNEELSTLTGSPNWPIFFWNLIHWRQEQLEGLKRANWRLGSAVEYTAGRDGTSVQVIHPDGQKRTYEPAGQTIVIQADRPGVYQIVTNTEREAFAVNALSADESDLRRCVSERHGVAEEAGAFWWEYRPYGRVLLLAAVLLLALHGYAVFSQSKGGTV